MAVFAGNGSNSAPSFTFSSDTNTGMYRQAADQLAFCAGGNHAMEIRNTDVGIGLGAGVAPAQRLHVKYANNIVGQTQIICEGYEVGYGAGVSFQSRLTNSSGTLKEMGNITGDGEASWDGTAANQDSGLRFRVTNDGTTGLEGMRLTSMRSLGVGTVGPANARTAGFGIYTSAPSNGTGGIYSNSDKNIFALLGARGMGAGSSTSVVDTGISINASTGGATYLMLAARNTSDGTSGDSALYLIQIYISGNNTPAVTFLGGDSNFVTFGVSGSNTLTTTGNSGNWFMAAIHVGQGAYV